ncbi:hypothetical protein [Paludisphaera mucosa]|uniref:Type II secretion system protein J n=1 Tax=Paludisphaera mucosa TaxID=3030827 RepID=A0ABT6FJI3_9BACT|nr:hypothetical protein [Paludisphaera mucosa]MDG3007704.1 hypothetical protein [Paludisphaera mucosa]
MRVREPRIQNRGFSLFETTVAALLMALAANLLADSWVAFGRPAISTATRARLAQEANLFAETLARDVGRLAEQPGTDSRYQNVQVVDATPPGSKLKMSIDDGKGLLQEICYSIDEDDPGKLVRTGSGPRRVVAALVTRFYCVRDELPVGPDNANVYGVRIDLTLGHRINERDWNHLFGYDHTRRYRIFIPDPQP